MALLVGASLLVFGIVRAAPGDPWRALGLGTPSAAAGPGCGAGPAGAPAEPAAAWAGPTAVPAEPAALWAGPVSSPPGGGRAHATAGEDGERRASPCGGEDGGAARLRALAASYLAWVGAAATGDFGTSFRTGRPVSEEIRRVGPNTLALSAGALAVTLAVAVPLGVAGALCRGSWLAVAATVAAYAFSALPAFFAGYAAIYLFTRRLGIFPLAFGGDDRLPWLAFVLPMVVLGVANGGVGEVIRHVRAAITRVLAEEYVRTARAKGAAVWRHAAAEGLLVPVAASLAAKVSFVLGGAVVVEQVFNWPGLGRLAWQAALDRDYPVILGLALLAAVVARAAALAAALVQAALAPGSIVAAPGGAGVRA